MFTTETDSHETETERSSLDMADSLRPNTRLVRLSMYVKRREGMNIDEFNAYWTNTHAPKVKQWLAKHGVVRYVQVSFMLSIVNVGEKLKSPVPLPSFGDGLGIGNLAKDEADPST